MRSLFARILLLGLALCTMCTASATQVTRFTPQGMLARIANVQADFDAPAMALGDDGAPDPFLIRCDADSVSGSGRWVDPQHWVYRFDQPLTGAVSCSAEPNPDFRDLQGQPLVDAPSWHFSTGGPRATVVRPWGERIDEDQVFVLRFNALTDPQSILAHAHCEVQGLGEAVPVRLIEGEAREQVLDAIGWERDAALRDRVQLLQCKRLLPARAQVRLVVGPGVSTPAQAGQPGVASTAVLARNFQVREAFHASLTCTRTNAQAPCSPLFPIELTFSSPVPRQRAAGVTLQTPQGPRQAQQLDASGGTNAEGAGNALDSLSFAPPFPEKSTLQLQVPADLRDDMGRVLDNAARFPLAITVDAMPPLVKFSTGPFGIVERFADGPPAQEQTPMAPLALRRVGPELRTRELMLSAGQASDHVTTDDVQALQWFARVQRLQEGTLTAAQFADMLALRPPRDAQTDEPLIDVRSRSMFRSSDDARVLQLPGLQDPDGQDIEMIGVPLPTPGLHVLEAASPRLGAALLSHEGATDGGTMYVRSAVLVTNLAVHVKTGRDDLLVWVTSLDDGQPVAGARVAVLSCDGRRLRDGQTDAQGVWHAMGALPSDEECPDTGQSGLFVTARIPADHPQAWGQADFSFAWTGWDRGIEPWRFGVPTSRAPEPDLVAHAVLDRTLLHAGETLSMKLFVRALDRQGVRNPDVKRLPEKIQIVHAGSGDSVDLPVSWQTSPGGGLFALLSYPIPDSARLGEYSIELTPLAPDDASEDRWTPSLDAGRFRVESFKLPLLTGSLKIAAGATSGAGAGAPLVDPRSLQADLQLNWISGGPARDLPATLSAVARPLTPSFANYSDFSFGVPDGLRGDQESAPDQGVRRLILDKRPVRLDPRGGARVTIAGLPPFSEPQSLLFEASFTDPNGEIQTIAQTAQVWPAAVVAGLQAGSWMARGESATVKLLALDDAGRPQADVPLQLDGRVRTTYTTRKRLVGGFYAYDSHEQIAALGTLCQGRSDARGQLECPVTLDRDGEIQLFALARDAQGRVSRAATTIWVWGSRTWFGGGDDDRIDVIPSRATWRPGETAEFTVRMPFRHAQALVAVEREGILETHVVPLDGDEPVVRLPVQARWGPNVYVSVLAVRGRVRQVSWSSFFDWGWRHPLDWVQARKNQVADAPVPTGLVDLAKPSFRFGVAHIRVSDESDRLQVQVTADRPSYQVRETAQVHIHALRPDGQPAAGAGVAFIAVDEALLELQENTSWDLLTAMRVERDYGVATATGQGEVVGRRHYGRKAVPAGGGGGFGATRELFDTLLLWRGDVVLDGQGSAQIPLPLNDALTRFRLVAVVDQGQGLFGTGSADITTTQDLQIVSGLPLVAREGDQYQARVTVRNRTQQVMTLTLSAQVRGAAGAGQSLPEQELTLEPGASQTLSWLVTAPVLSGSQDSESLHWAFEAHTRQGPPASDRIRVSQVLQPAVPVMVRQATLLQILAAVPQHLPVDASEHALRDAQGRPRGAIRVSLQSSLAGTLPGVHDWLAAYPYTCMEQLSSKAVGLQDPGAWQALMKRLPAYQADSGLLSYFPGGRGSVVLTAQLIEVTLQTQALGWPYALPAAARERMLAALQDFVFGRLEPHDWAPVDDLFWRKLIAIDALVRAGAWQPGMLDSFALDVSDWPSAAVVTWLSILQHVPDMADREALLAHADAVLRARLSRHGTSLVLSDATADAGWWLMSNIATAQARLLMAVLQRPAWRADLPRLLTGLLSLQSQGAWSTTTANVLGTLAVSQAAGRMETGAGQGAVRVSLAPAAQAEVPGEASGGASGGAWGEASGGASGGTPVTKAALPEGPDAPVPGASAVVPWADMPAADGIRRQTLNLNWPASGRGTLTLAQQGQGSGWATVTARAAVPQTQAVDAGMRVERRIVPVSQARAGHWSVGDIVRVQLRIHAREPVVWSVVSDPVPAGASILGSGLGRDSAIATGDESADQPWWDRPSFIERQAAMYRAYFEVMRAGTQVLEYTVRLNTPGDYQLPPTRVEALYQPDVFGSLPNAPFRVEPLP